MPKATTRFRSTALRPWRPAPPWSSCTPTSPPTASATSSTASSPPITPSTKPSKSRRASTTGQRSASTSLPASAADTGSQWVGDHIRPRVRVPESWHWPVGVEPLHGGRLSARRLLARHLDVGDSPHRRQAEGPLVLGHQPRARTHLARTRRESRPRFRARRQGQLGLHKRHYRRRRILRRLRQHHRHRQPPRSAAADLPRHRSQRLAQMGDQLRRRRRPNRRHRSLDRERYPRPSLRLGTAKEQVVPPPTQAFAFA